MAYRDTLIASKRRTIEPQAAPKGYYEGAHRVVRDGVPCRVFYAPSKAQKERLAAIRLACEAQVSVELDDCPQFAFEPLEGAERVYKAKGARPVPARPTSGAGADYYSGHRRYIIGGVPCRLAFDKGNQSYRHWANGEPMGGFDKWNERAHEWWEARCAMKDE